MKTTKIYLKLEFEPLTLEKAKTLKHGDSVYSTSRIAESDGTFKKFRWCVNGKVKRWKRTPDRIQIPIKHGLYYFEYINETNINLFEIELNHEI